MLVDAFQGAYVARFFSGGLGVLSVGVDAGAGADEGTEDDGGGAGGGDGVAGGGDEAPLDGVAGCCCGGPDGAGERSAEGGSGVRVSCGYESVGRESVHAVGDHDWARELGLEAVDSVHLGGKHAA